MLTEAQRLALAERLWDKCIPEPNSGCWLWLGALKNTGYGHFVFRVEGANINYLAHRISYEVFNGPIPDRMNILHKCDVRICINPDHLWPGTQKQNVADCYSKNRRVNRLKAFCKNGHELIPENCTKRGNGRRCAICARAANKRWYHAH